MTQEKKLVYVTGGKGGVGKSLFAMTVVDYLAQTHQTLLIDADPNNPDSSTSYQNKTPKVEAKQARVRSEDASGQVDASGLLDILESVEKANSTATVIDAPAGDSALLTVAGQIVTETCKALGIKSVFIWMIDSADKTPVNTLHAAWDAIKEADLILLVKNYRKGDNFQFFDNSKTIASITQNSRVKIINLPKIAARIADTMKLDRMTWEEIATKTPIATKVEAQRLRKTLHRLLRDNGL